MGIAAPFTTPFYSGSQVASDTPYYLPVSIGAHSYLLDLRKYQRQTIPPIRPPADNSHEPGEQSLNQEGLWRRSMQSFIRGAGREYFDDFEPGESLYEAKFRLQYWASKGLDPWTPKKLKLLYDTQNKRASANTNLKVLQVGTRLYVADGTALLFTNDPTPASPTFTDSTAGGTTVQSITTDGAKVWAVTTAGIRETVAGSTAASTLAAGTYTLVGYSNGRLIAANGNALYEISRVGTPTTIWTHSNPNFVWGVICSTPTGVLVGGTCVDRSDIYAVTNIDATGALAPPILAGSLPDGETLNGIEYYDGAVLLATSKGLRTALIGSNNSLSHGPAISITGGVLATEGQGEFIWFSWSNYDTASTGLGRANLATFVDNLLPAYASDLMATAQGNVVSVCTVGGKRYFAVSGVGFFGEMTTLVASGTYDSGKVRYGTTEKKIATALDLRYEPLPSGASIQASIGTEDGVSTAIGTCDQANSLSPPTSLAINISGVEAVKVLLTLNRAAALGPELRRWTLYSQITPVLSDEIILPLVVKDYVMSEMGEGERIWYDPLAEYQFLRNLAATKTIQIYQEGTASYAVRVTGVQIVPDEWNASRSFFNGTLLVRMVTADVV